MKMESISTENQSFMQAEDRNASTPDQIIEETGGCGRFQVRLCLVIHLVKTVFCFSFTNFIIITSTPGWWCVDGGSNVTSCNDSSNGLYCNRRTCETENSSKCVNYSFDDSLNTIVSEFHLVCEKDFIPSTINSLQLAGKLVGNVISGQTADLFGRKPVIFSAIILIFVFNLFGFFSTCWEMVAVSSFFTGIGYGFFITTQYNILSEFTLAKWRTWVIGFPSWPIQQCLFALVAWIIHDWRYLQLMTSLLALPCIITWFVIPESFRWYIAHGKGQRAKKIITSIAKVNRHRDYNVGNTLEKVTSSNDQQKKTSKIEQMKVTPNNDQQKLTSNIDEQKVTSSKDQRYTFLHLFKSLPMAKLTFLLMLNWVALSVVGYGISFGIQSLSGNLYLNLFLFSITSIPSKAMSMWLCNRIGRRKTSILFFSIVAVAGLTVGVLHTLDLPQKDQLTNILAIIANSGISATWGSVQTMTVELYPTVIRNIGFGTLSCIGGGAAVIGPQLVYFNEFLPGLLFYVCGAISMVCVFGTMFLQETMDKYLDDRIH